MDDHSTMMLLEAGESKIYLSERYESQIGCGLIPFPDSCNLCTKGLKWNLGNYDSIPSGAKEMGTLAFGTFISTSNEVTSNSQFVRVITDKPIFWCTSRIPLPRNPLPGNLELGKKAEAVVV